MPKETKEGELNKERGKEKVVPVDTTKASTLSYSFSNFLSFGFVAVELAQNTDKWLQWQSFVLQQEVGMKACPYVC